eukprot:scaffold218_cov67-Phaeocystis_antarctica.AAC.4
MQNNHSRIRDSNFKIARGPCLACRLSRGQKQNFPHTTPSAAARHAPLPASAGRAGRRLQRARAEHPASRRCHWAARGADCPRSWVSRSACTRGWTAIAAPPAAAPQAPGKARCTPGTRGTRGPHESRRAS